MPKIFLILFIGLIALMLNPSLLSAENDVNQRIQKKLEHQSYEDWLKEFKTGKPNNRVNQNDLLPDQKTTYAIPSTHPLLLKKAWKRYKKADFYADMEATTIKNLDNAERQMVETILLLPAPKPRFFKSDSVFAAFRINKLIELGFPKSATTLFIRNRFADSPSADFLDAGFRALLLSNHFDAACLEQSFLDESDPLFEKWGLLKTLCAVYSSDKSQPTQKLSLKKTIKTPDESVFIPFLMTLAAKGKISLRIEGFSFNTLPLFVMPSFISNEDVPLSLKEKLLPKAMARFLIEENDLYNLLQTYPSFRSISGQRSFTNFEKAATAQRKIQILIQQVKKNRSFISPESKLYARDLDALHADESLMSFFPFVYSFFTLNSQFEQAKDWKLPEDEIKNHPVFSDFSPITQKKDIFFIFPLYEALSIMLKQRTVKNEVVTDHLKKLFEIIDKAIYKNDFTQQSEGYLRHFKGSLDQKIAKRFQRSVLAKDPVQAFFSSLVLANEEIDGNEKEDHLKKKEFVLLGLAKVQLQNYAISMAHNMIMKIIDRDR